MCRSACSAALLLLALILTLPVYGGETPPPKTEEARLEALFEEDWEWRLRQNPFFATVTGDDRYNARVPDLSREAIAAREAYEQARLARIRSIDRSRLPERQRLNYDLFLYEAKLAVEGHAFPQELLQLNQLEGPHLSILSVAQRAPRRNLRDLEDYLARLRAFPRYLDQVTALLREGADSGITPARIVLGSVAEQIRAVAPDDATRSQLYSTVFEKLPPHLPPREAARVQAEGRRVLTESLLPALRRFADFVETEYVPRARLSLGALQLPNGKAWYAYRVKAETSLPLAAERIHERGLAEVKRIRGQMASIQKAAGFKGSFDAFLTFMRTDKRFVPPSRDALLVGYRDIAKRIDPELPRLFGLLPRLTYGVYAMDSSKERTAPAAYYLMGSLEAGRAGKFEVNTYNLEARPTWEMEALTLHETVPGHHLQLALAQEEAGLPNFRRWGDVNGFIEGWGLYAESLGEELGLYTDPYSRFGRANLEMWRAIRLVLDTGIHAKGWSREQAVDFFKRNSGKAEHEIEVEVDRYIAWPGQALSYKLGELKLQELRALASRELGERFDIRAFHTKVLTTGAVPLEVLEREVRGWIAARKAAGPGPRRP